MSGNDATAAAVEDAKRLAAVVQDSAEVAASGLNAEVAEFVSVLVDANPIGNERISVKNGNYVMKPRNFGENLHWHRFWYERAWRFTLLFFGIAAITTFAVLYCWNTSMKVPLFTVSSADKHYAPAAAYLATHGITYDRARVPVTLIPVELRPSLALMLFWVVATAILVYLSLDFWSGHISRAEFVARDIKRRQAPRNDTPSSHWWDNAYSRVSGINSAVNTMSAYGIDPAAPWIDLGCIVGLYALTPVFTSTQDYIAFFWAIPFGLMDCYVYYGNLYKIAMDSNPKSIVVSILVHFILRFTFIAPLAFGAYRWFVDNSHYEVPRTRWALYGAIVALSLHLVFCYMGALRRAFLHWSGKSAFGRKPDYYVTNEKLTSIPLYDTDNVSRDPEGREYYFDKMIEGFTWEFMAPKLATACLGGFALAIEISCAVWMEDTLYVK